MPEKTDKHSCKASDIKRKGMIWVCKMCGKFYTTMELGCLTAKEFGVSNG